MTEQVNQEEAKAPKQELLVLDPFQHQEAELNKLAADYTNMVVTEENLKDAEAARLKLWRIRVKEIGKALKERVAKIKEFKDDQETKAEKLCNIIQPVEEALEKKIAEVTAAKEKREREEKEKEQKRLTGHRTKLSELTKINLKINSMSLEELNAIDISWTDTYDGQEFKEEFSSAVAAITTAKANRVELLELRKKEEERKKQEDEAKEAAEQRDKDFKALTKMLTDVNLTEDVKQVEVFLEIAENTKPEIYGTNAVQAEGILSALKMLSETRKEFLVKRALNAVTFKPKVEETPQFQNETESQEETEVLKMEGSPELGQTLKSIPEEPLSFNRPAFGTPKDAPSITMENHVPDMHEPKEEVQYNTSGSGKPAFEESEFNVFSYASFKVALSKNVPEKAAKSILNYCEHMLKGK